MQDAGQLQPEHDEDEPVEEKGDYLPKDLRLKTETDGIRGRVPTQINAGRDGGEHARNRKAFGKKISRKGCEERKSDLDWCIVEIPVHPAHDQADEQAERDAAHANENETQACRA